LALVWLFARAFESARELQKEHTMPDILIWIYAVLAAVLGVCVVAFLVTQRRKSPSTMIRNEREANMVHIGNPGLVSRQSWPLRVLRPHERAAVFRVGRFAGVIGPGLVWSVPVIDLMLVVDLDQGVPGWQGLTEAERRERVRRLVLNE
jgi:hypothetical protein